MDPRLAESRHTAPEIFNPSAPQEIWTEAVRRHSVHARSATLRAVVAGHTPPGSIGTDFPPSANRRRHDHCSAPSATASTRAETVVSY